MGLVVDALSVSPHAVDGVSAIMERLKELGW